MKTINSRLYEFITEDQELTPKQFAEKTGIKQKLITELITGEKTTIDKDTIAKISTHYPALNIEWLKTGIGEKTKSTAEKRTRNHWANREPTSDAEIMESISERIRNLRKQKRLTMPDVAKVIKIGISGYSAIEQGYSKISVPKLIKLKLFYNTTWEFLLEGKKYDAEKIKEIDEANKIIKHLTQVNQLLTDQIALLKENKKK